MSYSSTEAAQREVFVEMPQMGVSVAEGTVAVWHKQVGDRVERDEIICEVSTDKIDTDLPSPAAGRVSELLVAVDETVPVGTPLARIATDAAAGEAHPAEHELTRSSEDEASHGAAAAQSGSPEGQRTQAAEQRVADGPRRERTQPAPEHPPAGNGRAQTGAPEHPPDGHGTGAPEHPPDGNGAAQTGAPEHPPDGNATGAPVYSPVVQRIAIAHGIDLTSVKGSGRGGRVRKQDVLAAAARPDAAAPQPDPPRGKHGSQGDPMPEPAPAAGEGTLGPAVLAEGSAPADAYGGEARAEPLSRMRRAIAEHMTRSLQTAAHCTTIIEADFSRVERERARLGGSPLPIVARAVVDALRRHPALNATLEGEILTTHRDVNLGIAVSLGERGLIVPVVARAQDLSSEGLARRIGELARRAREGALTPDEVRGGTFTITNPGSFGSIASTPIINQPQVAILDLEAVVKRPVVISDGRGADAIAIRPMAHLCLSWDHRALDGALAAQFLATLRGLLEGKDADR